MRVIRVADQIATPWKNGQGVTREIAAHPPGAGLADFDWRVSIAKVDASGPFSHFPDMDRRLGILEGVLALKIDGGAAIKLCPNAGAIAFPGDVPVHAEVLEGPVTDLNVMSRRGRYQTTMTRLRIEAAATIAVSKRTMIVLQSGAAALTFKGQGQGLQAQDAACFESQAAARVLVEPSEPTSLFVIEIAGR